jgi:hypothetical protein
MEQANREPRILEEDVVMGIVSHDPITLSGHDRVDELVIVGIVHDRFPEVGRIDSPDEGGALARPADGLPPSPRTISVVGPPVGAKRTGRDGGEKRM